MHEDRRQEDEYSDRNKIRQYQVRKGKVPVAPIQTDTNNWKRPLDLRLQNIFKAISKRRLIGTES
jgi:hypothetical protein